jgi:hypothetical protein
MALLPGVTALIMSATLSGVIAAESAVPRTGPAAETAPLPARAGFLNGVTGAAPGAHRQASLHHRTALQHMVIFTTG